MNNTTRQAKRQYTFKLQDSAGEILGAGWPVSRCLKSPISSAAGVEIRHDGEKAHFHGVQTCKSAWSCPVCSKRIMAGRKAEIESILLKAGAKGWRSLFLTVTLSHHSNSRLEELLKALIAAWRSVFSGDRTGERAPFARVMGQIKTLEIRYGKNGFHPHLHVLLIVDECGMSELEAGLFEDQLSESVFSRYARAVERSGMRVEREAYHWRPVSSAGAAAHYVSKLESALEMTSPDTKEGNAGGSRSYSMFQLLAKYNKGERRVYRHEIAELFREFAFATKGKRQVSYSRGINELGIEVKEDEELALEPEKAEEKVLAVMSAGLWRAVCERKLRAELLNIADKGDELSVRAWLEKLEDSAGLAPPEPPPWDYDESFSPAEELESVYLF